MSIEVKITRHELVSAGQQHSESTPREMEKYILARLKHAGVPVTGEAFFLGLERGTLSVRADADLNGWRFRWSRA